MNSVLLQEPQPVHREYTETSKLSHQSVSILATTHKIKFVTISLCILTIHKVRFPENHKTATSVKNSQILTR